MKTKLKDFVEVDYIGKIKDNNQIFDLTSEEIAKKEGIFNKEAKYGPRIICLGESQILKKLDEFLVDKEVGEEYNLDLKPEEAFGKKHSELIKTVPADILTKQKIKPFPGLQLHAGGLMGTIRSVTGGRVIVDFNHPLAGRSISYKIILKRIVDNDQEKLKSIVENMLNLSKEEYSLEIKENRAKISLKVAIPVEAKEEVKEKVKKLIPSLEITFN